MFGIFKKKDMHHIAEGMFKEKTKAWWWLIDRLDQLSPEQRSKI